MIIWKSTDMIIDRDEKGTETITWLNQEAVGARLEKVDPHLPEEKIIIKTDLETKLQTAIAKLKTDLGLSTDTAGSTTINAILNQTNSVINSSPATYVKALARIIKTNQKNDIRDLRLLLRDLAEPDDDI